MADLVSSSIRRPVRHVVYGRRVADGMSIPFDGSLGGWTWVPQWQCEKVVQRKGPAVGEAHLQWVPISSSEFAAEQVLASMSHDDQVQVRVWPHEDELALQPADENQSKIVFEGYVGRVVMDIQGREDQSSERVSAIAFPLPRLDNESSDHIITGRWTRYAGINSGSGRHFVVESPSQPAVFNFRGRPNRIQDPDELTWIQKTAYQPTLLAPVFTHDDDPAGRFWTVGEALASILVMWLFGRLALPLTRHIDIESATAAALTAAASGTDGTGQFAGLTARIPEVNVHGLGVLDAIDAVCQAGGFEFALEPTMLTAIYDRRYILRLWHKGSGRGVWLELAPRGSSYSSAEDQAIENRESQILAMSDAGELVNEVFARGRSFIECKLVLKPLWNPSDVDGSTIDTNLQQTVTETLLTSHSYYQRHVTGGSLYKGYGHVGRMWGIDCLGGIVDGYTSGVYEHDIDGFDFVTELAVEAGEIGSARNQLGISDAIKWTRRLRHALPLRSPAAALAGKQYILEVSEDGGTTWQDCHASFSTLREWLGIIITDVPNLASVDNGSLKTPEAPTPATSWWALIQSQQLLFRLTCVIEADHAARYDATRRSVSATRHRRGQLLLAPSEEVWVAPETAYNSSGAWVRISGFGADIGDSTQITTVRQIAEARRDKLDTMRLTASSVTGLIDVGRFRLGDNILGLRKRRLSFSVNAGQSVAWPNIAAITYTLAPGVMQSIRLNLDDTAMGGGL